MKLSVIVPVYNVENYLDACLRSLVEQTIDDYEILVVNDGSPDHSQDIIDQYVEKFPNLIRSFVKENGGQATARNFALDLAQGDYIAFVDSDDWVDTDMYQSLYAVAMESGADLVICDTDDHFPTYDLHHKPSNFTNKFHQTPSPCNKLIKRSFIGDIRFPDGLWYEDFVFFVKLAMKTDHFARCHKAFYHCNCRQESTMFNNNSPKNLDILTAMQCILDYAKENNYYEKYKSDIEYMMIDHILITSINRVALQTHPEKKHVLQKLRNYVNRAIPDLKNNVSFASMPRNRKIIASLNSKGLHGLSKVLLKTKSSIK